MDELLRQCLEGVDVEVLPRGAAVADLRDVDEADPPPIVILASESPTARRFERDLLAPHPQAVILRVEENGHVLATRSVEVHRRVHSAEMNPQTIADAIRSAPTWRARFD
ncbi:hypothetical protein [Microbacterium terricola]|nr:hypothetical protein [Microbacterium terricola]UYK40706.1 hypothetical protein OAU46_03380 [Microbacterium terricola]